MRRFFVELLCTAGLTAYYKSFIYVVLHTIMLPFTFFNHPLVKVFLFRESHERPFKPLTYFERFEGLLVEVRMSLHDPANQRNAANELFRSALAHAAERKMKENSLKGKENNKKMKENEGKRGKKEDKMAKIEKMEQLKQNTPALTKQQRKKQEKKQLSDLPSSSSSVAFG